MRNPHSPPNVRFDLRVRSRSLAAGRTRPTTEASTARLLRHCMEHRRDDDWHDLLERHGSTFRIIAERVLRASGCPTHPEEVDDLVQEMLLRWCRVRHGFEGRTEDAAWKYINTSMRHAAIDLVRHHLTVKRCPKAVGLPLAVCGLRRARDPEDLAIQAQRRRRIFQLCQQMGTGHRVPPRHGAQIRDCQAESHHARDRRAGELRAPMLGGEACTEHSSAEERSDPADRRPDLAMAWVIFLGYTSREASHRLGHGTPAAWVDSQYRKLRRRLAAEGIELPKRRPTRSALRGGSPQA